MVKPKTQQRGAAMGDVSSVVSSSAVPLCHLSMAIFLVEKNKLCTVPVLRVIFVWLVAEVVECPWALILQPVSNAPLAASSMAMPGFQ